MNRKIRFYVHEAFDGGAFDSPEIEYPMEVATGYFIGIVHKPFPMGESYIIQSEILIEREDHSVTCILPKQLIQFIN